MTVTYTHCMLYKNIKLYICLICLQIRAGTESGRLDRLRHLIQTTCQVSLLKGQSKGEFLGIFKVLYASLLLLQPLIFHCVEGCWD
jgi:hypothetical protein